MGISGLTTFISQKFKGWKPVNYDDWGHVILMVTMCVISSTRRTALGHLVANMRNLVTKSRNSLGHSASQ